MESADIVLMGSDLLKLVETVRVANRIPSAPRSFPVLPPATMTPQRSLFLGDLEQAVMARLWSSGPQDVKACHLAIGRSRRITHNTVQSTMERLFRKGLLRRDKVSHAFVYSAILSREEYGAQLARDGVAAAVGSAAPGSLLAAFVDLAERIGDEGLSRLEQLIAARRAAARERP